MNPNRRWRWAVAVLLLLALFVSSETPAMPFYGTITVVRVRNCTSRSLCRQALSTFCASSVPAAAAGAKEGFPSQKLRNVSVEVLKAHRRSVFSLWSADELRCDPTAVSVLHQQNVVLDEALSMGRDARRQRTVQAQSAEDAYRSWTEYDGALQNLTAAFSNKEGLRIDLQVFGRSYEGRALTVVCFSDRRLGASDDTPTLLLIGGMHAREWISSEVSLRIAERIAHGFSTNRRIHRVLSRLRLCVAPNVNPDGFVYSWGPGWDGYSPKRMWRKNRHVLPSGGVGVDLNRNFDVEWNNADSESGSDDVTSNTYRGPSQLSELESQGIAALHQRMNRLDAFISLHSYGEEIEYPLGYADEAVGPNNDLLRSLGVVMRDAMTNVTGHTYEVSKASDPYTATGDAVDSVYVHHDYVPSYTIETRPSITGCCGFVLHPSQIEDATKEVLTAVMLLAEYVVAARTAQVEQGVVLVWANHHFNPSLVVAADSDGNGVADFVQDDYDPSRDPDDSFAVGEATLLYANTTPPLRYDGATATMGAWLRRADVADTAAFAAVQRAGGDLPTSVQWWMAAALNATLREVVVSRAVMVVSWDAIMIRLRFETPQAARARSLLSSVAPLLRGGPAEKPPLYRVWDPR